MSVSEDEIKAFEGEGEGDSPTSPNAFIVDLAGGNLYLALRPNSGDGTRYWNNDGPVPMRLEVTCAP